MTLVPLTAPDGKTVFVNRDAIAKITCGDSEKESRVDFLDGGSVYIAGSAADVADELENFDLVECDRCKSLIHKDDSYDSPDLTEDYLCRRCALPSVTQLRAVGQ